MAGRKRVAVPERKGFGTRFIEGSGATRSEPDYVWDNHMLRIEQV